MKKRLIVISLALLLVVGLVACGDSSTPENTKVPEDNVAIEKSSEENIPGIKGSQAYDIILSLNDKGIPKADTVHTDDGFQYDSMTTDYAYSITANSKHEIMCAQFLVLSEDNGYLGFCASLPYDDADAETATKWVNENIGTEAETTIGDAYFKLSVGTTGPILTVQALDFDDYVMSKIS